MRGIHHLIVRSTSIGLPAGDGSAKNCREPSRWTFQTIRVCRVSSTACGRGEFLPQTHGGAAPHLHTSKARWDHILCKTHVTSCKTDAKPMQNPVLKQCFAWDLHGICMSVHDLFVGFASFNLMQNTVLSHAKHGF
ncbi:hypothetical protein Y032_0074g908 [Ancylostoma ceylanicum]|uniref:Uncharacterized protein n=1 Tax=Ancylostoma ceylanicum TaxID=53326 RepID=A0A016TVM6_9BILA|nr:hypothetical protein Y032_0074g908 [Ancylostoma ceylanicum]